MARSRPDKRNKKRKKTSNASVELLPEMAQPLLDQATAHLQMGETKDALTCARKALQCLNVPAILPVSRLPVLELLGEIYIELGDASEAQTMFQEAAELDPEGELPESAGGGADKFLWLAQLSEDGGADSVGWFEKGCAVLRRETSTTEGLDEEEALQIHGKRRKLADALCGVAEIYMTDLSWEDDAETRAESLVTEACMVAPDSPGPLQTLASVRLSQLRKQDAQAALQRSMSLWINLAPESPDIPDFPERISLSRLLMEAEMEDKAMDVLERLVQEDDSSVEAWYLGGWCLRLLGLKEHDQDGNQGEAADGDEHKAFLNNSRNWLLNSLRLYGLVGYEDIRLYTHATDLVKELDAVLGPLPGGEDEDEWEDEEDLDDQMDI